MRHFLVSISVLATAGCATTSFAPPIVDMHRELRAQRNQTFFDAVCTPDPIDKTGTSYTIDRGVDGALLLINNYILTYRCQADRASEGRQFFEVPGFLTTIGAAAAAAFGAPTWVAIGAGATGAALNQGKSYYAPKDKGAVLNDGVEAMVCIKTEAVGIDAYTLEAISDLQEATGDAVKEPPARQQVLGGEHSVHDEGSSITVTSERQYFDMVQGALFSVERVVAGRLSDAGKAFDASGVLAEFEKAKDKVAEAEKEGEGDGAVKEGEKVLATPEKIDGQGTGDLKKAEDAKGKLVAAGARNVGTTVIKLKTLQPRLQQCILRAKL